MSSKITNYIGKTIYVDDVKTFSGKKKVSIADNLRDTSLALLSIDTSKIGAEVEKIGSDGVVTEVEKERLKREWASIKAQFSFASSQANEYGINGQQVYTKVLESYTTLNTFLSELLAIDGSVTLSDVLPEGRTMLGLFENYYDALELLNDELFQYQTGLLNGLDDRTKCELHLACSSGLALPDDGSAATLSVLLLKDGVDATAEMSDEDFTWSRQDGSWAIRTGKSIEITDVDLVDGTANFTCRFVHHYSDSMYWYAFDFITVQRYVQPITVQVTSTNGDKFRQGTVDTILIATVFRGDDDITDSVPSDAFRWYRSSRDLTSDEAWNTSSKGLAKKQIELSPDDVSGRAVFSCEVDISQI